MRTQVEQVIDALTRLRKPMWLSIGVSALAFLIVASTPLVHTRAPWLTRVMLLLAIWSIALSGVMELVRVALRRVQAGREGAAAGRARRNHSS